jgi:NodT family efflux transporter outer membrane factor (OMF) lipoprotein
MDYFELRAADAQQQLLDETVKAFEAALRLTTNRFQGGAAPKSDVAQAQTQLDTTRAQATDVAVQRAQLEHAIALLTGKPPSDVSISPAPVERKFPDIPPGVPSELLERRPDIAASERRVAGANAQIGVAQAAFYPTLTLSAAGGFAGSSFAHLLSTPARFWSLGAALAQTIFDAGLRRAQTDQAIAAYDATVATYRQTVLTGFQEVEDNLAALRILEQEAAVQEDAVKSARESLAITLNQYRAGTANYLAVVVVQAQALSNERTAVGILGQRLNASVALIKALGGGWKETPAAVGSDASGRNG